MPSQTGHRKVLYSLLQRPKRMGGKELKPATAHLVHRTASVAFKEAVRRRHMVENPASIAKPPRVEQEEIVPFTRDEARKLIGAAAEARNGARYIVALSVGLRRGGALWPQVGRSGGQMAARLPETGRVSEAEHGRALRCSTRTGDADHPSRSPEAMAARL